MVSGTLWAQHGLSELPGFQAVSVGCQGTQSGDWRCQDAGCFSQGLFLQAPAS